MAAPHRSESLAIGHLKNRFLSKSHQKCLTMEKRSKSKFTCGSTPGDIYFYKINELITMITTIVIFLFYHDTKPILCSVQWENDPSPQLTRQRKLEIYKILLYRMNEHFLF